MTFNHFQYLPLERYKYLYIHFFFQNQSKKINLFIFVLHGAFPESCVATLNKLKGRNYFAQLPLMKYEKEK